MTKIVELRQDRSFIRSNFDGYKLSLDPVPILSQDLPVSPNKAETSEEQYSFLHAELFTLQNLLQQDPWERYTAYFVNSLGEVVRTAYDVITGRPQPTVVVFRLAKPSQPRVKGDYNYSMRFISEKYCVLCDGINRLHLLETGDRLKSTEWQQVATTDINTSNKDEINFTIYDCRLDIIKEQKKISCALGNIQRIEDENRKSSIHLMHLHLTRWTQKSNSWQFSIISTLEGKGSLYYCAFEPRAESVIISSNHQYKFRSKETRGDSDAGAISSGEPVQRIQLHDETAEVSGFSWSQSNDDLVIKFDTREGKSKINYKIQCTTMKLTVKCDEEVLFDRELYAAVDQDLTTWTIENNYLQVTLMKGAPSLHWPTIVAEGIAPKETPGSTDRGMEQKPVANLEAPIEDCDFPIDGTEENKIWRFDIASKMVTHSVFLGSTPPLFVTTLRPGFPAAFATRQNVDACLWLQQYNPSKPNEWSLRHEGNLHAFGYIQASKQQRKFIDCSPDLSYVLICESHRHIFLYKSNHDTASGLRNRNGPQVTIGKQHIITLKDVGEVLGITTAANVVTVLTEKKLLYLQIN